MIKFIAMNAWNSCRKKNIAQYVKSFGPKKLTKICCNAIAQCGFTEHVILS